MKKTTSLIILAGTLFSAAYAQTDVDAFRFSRGSITGTGRFTGMSGAFGALGGDFTSLSYNPAGIAVYRSSEFTFTPSIYVGKTGSTFLGQSYDESKYNFNFGNVGLIYTKKLNDSNSPGWKSWNFGIGYNRLSNFHNRSYYEGLNTSNSLVDMFAEQAGGHDPSNLDPFFEGLAYETYLITDSANDYISTFLHGSDVKQRRTSETRGAIGETVFSFGGNYSNKFYFGASLGFKSLRFVENSTYEEFDPDTAIDNFHSLKFQQDLTTRGVGFNFKIGMIFRANDMVRLGAAIETPTWYSMHDDYKTSMIADVDSNEFTFESPDGSFDYDLTTPFKAMGSIALVFGQQGLFSVDYEFSDYGEARFDAGGSPYSDVNNLIRRKYMETHTIRAGTEWIYENLAFRAGISFVTSPLNNSFREGGQDFVKKGFSLGFGYREANMFFDLGYARTMSNEFFQPYTLSYESVSGVKSDVVTNNFTATLGFKF